MFGDQLNDAQRAAATHGDGPLLIVAGAGTGKTATLAARVAWLIEQGTRPERILLLTFSRRGAREMLSRAERMTGADAGKGVGRHLPRRGQPAAPAARTRRWDCAPTSPCSTRPTAPT